MKWDNKTRRRNDANHYIVHRLAKLPRLHVRSLLHCDNCGAPATVIVGWVNRCDPCANHLVTLWNEVRSNLDEGD